MLRPEADDESGTDPHSAEPWLAYLAHGLHTHGRAIFFLDNMDPGWLPDKAARRRYRGIFTLAVALPPTLLLTAVAAYTHGLRAAVFSGLISGGVLFGGGWWIAPRTSISRGRRAILYSRRQIRKYLRILSLIVVSGIGGVLLFEGSQPDVWGRVGVYLLLPIVAFFTLYLLPLGGDALADYLLRRLVAGRGLFPFSRRSWWGRDARAAGFLNRMVDRGLLYRVGDGWMFRHRLLRDHLAAQTPVEWEPPHN